MKSISQPVTKEYGVLVPILGHSKPLRVIYGQPY
jgi:hypothetical protein